MKLYDEVDMRRNWSDGYWKGAAAGVLGTLVMCLLIGLFYPV